MPKIVAGNIYVHRLYLDTLSNQELKLVSKAIPHLPEEYGWNLVKIARDRKSVTFSRYPNFDKDPHPELAEWVKIDLSDGTIRRGIGSRENPLILHRKETFIAPEAPQYEKFAALTRAEEQAGLYAPQHLAHIGRKKYWERLLADSGLYICDYDLRRIDPATACVMSGRTAISRRSPSKPARFLWETRMLLDSVFDWGCGKGADLDFFKSKDLQADGYDLNHFQTIPPHERTPGEFANVTCFYVLNTMAFMDDRLRLLDDIYAFLPPAGRVYIAVRTRAEIEGQRRPEWKPLLDGWLTTSGTFQKGFDPQELLDMMHSSGFGDSSVLLNDPLMVCGTKQDR